MTEKADNEIDTSEIKNALYSDAFGEKTEKGARNLLIVATITLITDVFDVAVKSTPLIPLDFSNRPDSLIVFLSILNIALLFSYLLRALNDVLRVREEWANARIFIERQRAQRVWQQAKDIETAIDAADPRNEEQFQSLESWWEDAKEADESARDLISAIEAKIIDRRLPITVRWLRIWLLGSLPIMVGALAAIHTWRDAFQFVLSVFEL